jgi:hypothetical protein
METNKLNMFKSLIEELNNQYKYNEYIINRLETHLSNLPTILEQEDKKNIARIAKQHELTNELEKFCKIFLNNNQYFYVPYNGGTFYEYDGECYKIIQEDDIHYKLLSTITNDEKLNQWKHKSKNYIIQKIKKRSLLNSTPETFTIQKVISFFNTYFKNKTEIKYFLTVLGDCFLKKNKSNIYFVSSNFKNCISLIDSIFYSISGSYILSNFATKCHDSNNLENYKIINTRENDIKIVKNIIFDMGIDIICVSTHYSERYGDSNTYLASKKDDLTLVNFFSKNTLEDIITNFTRQCIEFTSNSCDEITWKDMHYIWKSYLASINVPNMVYMKTLQDILKTELKGTIGSHKDDIVFKGMTSYLLPKISSFLKFWDDNITVLETKELNELLTFEIDEIFAIYKNVEKKSHLTDKELIKIINNYYSPYIVIVNDKYIYNIECKLWDKQKDIRDFLDFYKNTNKEMIDDIISFDELYNSYKLFNKQKYKNKINVSKNYFENFINENLNTFITFERFVSIEWLSS